MKFLENLQKKQHEMLFAKGKPLEKLFPLFEAGDTFMLTPGEVKKFNALFDADREKAPLRWAQDSDCVTR